MKLFVCRHGRTEANASGLLLGRADPPLDAVGRTQASQIAAALPPGARVVSSPLARCVQTAEAYGADVEVEDALIELDYGDFDLSSMDEIPADTMREWRANPAFAPPNGESLQQLADRVGAFLDRLVDSAAQEDDDAVGERSAGARDIAIFSHVSPIKASMAWALGVGIGISWRSHVAQASITVIDVSKRGPSLHAFNRVDHLS